MSWDSADQAAKNAGVFLSMADGESVVIAMLGEPQDREGKWGTKIAFNVVNLDGGGPPQIFEFTPKMFKEKVKPQRDAFATQAFTLTRIGEEKETRYTFVPARSLTKEEIAELAKASLHDLKAKTGAASSASAPPPF